MTNTATEILQQSLGPEGAAADLEAAYAALLADPDDAAASVRFGRLAALAGDRDLALGKFVHALRLYEGTGDFQSVSAIGHYVAEKVHPRAGLEMLLELYVKHRRFSLASEVQRSALEMAGLHRELQAIQQEAAAAGNLTNLNGFENKHLEIQEQNRAKGLGPALINTMPKSGTMFLAEHLHRIYGTTFLRIGVDTFPRSYLVDARTAVLARGGLWDQMHFDPSAENLATLRRNGLTKLFLHLRDPRQATLSWLHHLDKETTGEGAYRRLRIWAVPPDDYDDLPMPQKVEWNARNTFPVFVQWAREWHEVLKDGTGWNIHVSEFARFREDPSATVRAMLAFFELPEPQKMVRPKEGQLHYRKGSASEWRDVFPLALQREMNRSMPPELCDAFGWENGPRD